MAQRVAPGKIFFRKSRVDDGNGLRVALVARIELSSAQQRDFESREKAVAYFLRSDIDRSGNGVGRALDGQEASATGREVGSESREWTPEWQRF